MIETRASHRYAKAMLEIARELNILPTVEEDFKTLQYAIENSSELNNLLSRPTIAVEKKAALLQEIFQEKVSEAVLRFLVLLAKKGRSGILYGTTISFHKQLNLERGIATANVVSAIELNDGLKGQIETKLTKMTGQTISAKYRVDKSLIGGFTARIDDLMIDASVRRQLVRLHETLAEEAHLWTPTL